MLLSGFLDEDINDIIAAATALGLHHKQTLGEDDTRIKLEFEQKVIRLRDGAVAAEGKVRNVFTDKDGKPTRIDVAWLERMKQITEVDNTKE